jgi:hypothetical protein
MKKRDELRLIKAKSPPLFQAGIEKEEKARQVLGSALFMKNSSQKKYALPNRGAF